VSIGNGSCLSGWSGNTVATVAHGSLQKEEEEKEAQKEKRTTGGTHNGERRDFIGN
jgi:hypothetical protein